MTRSPGDAGTVARLIAAEDALGAVLALDQAVLTDDEAEDLNLAARALRVVRVLVQLREDGRP